MKAGLATITELRACIVFAVCGMVSMADVSAVPVGPPTHQSAFDSTVRKFNVKPGTKSVTVEWSYTNRWDFPLLVEKFDQSCGCLSGSPDQQTVDPGKTGKIHAVFTPGTYRGTLRKSLHVRFVGFDKPVELVAEATIPSSVELSQHDLHWTTAEASVSKTVEVTSGTGADFTITGLLGVPENRFVINSETIVPGKHYRLHIRAVGSLVAGIQCLQIRTDSSDPRDRVLAMFLHSGASPTTVLNTTDVVSGPLKKSGP